LAEVSATDPIEQQEQDRRARAQGKGQEDEVGGHGRTPWDTTGDARCVPGPGRCSGPKTGRSRTPPCALPHRKAPYRVIRHCVAPGTGVATLASMNTTRTIDSTFDLSTPAAVAHAS